MEGHAEESVSSESEKELGDKLSPGKKKASTKPVIIKPNYFICQRIVNPDLLSAIGCIINKIIAKQPLYTSAALSLSLLHLTWCTLRLEDQSEVEKCLLCLKSSREELQKCIPKEPIRFEGLGQFRGHLLYAYAHEDPSLGTFAHRLLEILEKSGFKTPGNKTKFFAHSTVIKRNRKVSRQLKSKWIDDDLIDEFDDVSLGEQCVDSLELCKIGSLDEEHSFYESVGTISLAL